MSEKQRLFAFWGYDLYPYVLGAEVLSFTEGGYVNAKGYGGYRFKPFLIVPYEEGAKIRAELEKLTQEHREAKEALHAQFMQKAFKVLPALKDKRDAEGNGK